MRIIFETSEAMMDCVESLKNRRYVYKFFRTGPDEYVVEWDIF